MTIRLCWARLEKCSLKLLQQPGLAARWNRSIMTNGVMSYLLKSLDRC